MKNKDFSISNIFIALSLAWTIFWSLEIYYFFPIWNDIFSNFFNFFLFTFLHGWIFHFIWNSIILFYFWNAVEEILWKNKFLLFFVFYVIFEWISILLINWYYNAIWMSGFWMWILSFYTLYLKFRWSSEYKTWIFFIFLNILYWLLPWISFLWHLFWALSWVVFYFFYKVLKKR